MTYALLGTVLLGSPCFAQDDAADSPRKTPAPFPQFESKTLKPPQPGSQKRITIQITPEVDIPEVPAALPTVDGEARYSWFWQDISPSLEETGPARLDDALQAIRGAQSVSVARLDDLQKIVSEHAVSILTETVQAQISPALVLAMIAVESSGRLDAVSSAGAQGLMQLTPETAERFGVKDVFDPAQNIAGGIAYLSWLMERFNGDPVLVLAAYNAGAGAIRDHQGVPDYVETRDYVPKVLATFDVARSMCKTPPLLISDGCVFQNMN
ncbi:lytic transglycosylase domain-containing protein [Epibacterium ulvae]|uniref:lytic transglycosylase domain-containing protein n=1 Tax=Epibacterium ulvae TaxID=1156985 RepID=UPI00248F86CB|nr:transglycosylase SLT domain-containing protein [Epibacterium ulvae]